MVSLPQPELDEEVKCDHSDIHHTSIECYLEAVPNDDIIEALNKIETWIKELN